MRTLIIATSAAAALCSSAVFAQQPTQVTASISDFSGIWAHPSIPGFEPPASGPGPVVNKSRIRNGPQKGRSAFNQSEQLEFTVDDEGVFTTPWSATITYRPGLNWRGAAEWPEVVCVENILFSSGKDAAVPRANKPDF
jgi:hypothetical protein